MGYNTPVLILNDHLHAVRDDAEVGRLIYEAAGRTFGRTAERRGEAVYTRYGVGVLEPKHADATRIVVIGQNQIRELAELWYCGSEPEDLLRALADQMGYRLVRKAKRGV